MSNTSNIAEAVLWHEGMLLMPQHFQETDIRTEALLHKKLSCLNNYGWGVHVLEYDSALILQGLFRVTSLQAILPDGQFVNWGNTATSATAALEIEIPPELAKRPEGVSIWLCLPVALEGTKIDESAARYRSVETICRDLTTSEETIIPRKAPNISLWAGDAPPAHLVSLQLIRIVMQQGEFAPNHFVAPTMLIHKNSVLFTLCSAICEKIRFKAERVADKTLAIDTQDKTSLVEARFTMHCLLSGLPILETLLYSENAHPLWLFTALQRIASGAASLSATQIPPQIRYTHENPLQCFTKLAKFIKERLEAALPDSYSARTFTQDGNTFSINLGSMPAPQHDYIIGVFPSKVADKDATKLWIEHAIITTDFELEQLTKQRRLGAHRQHVTHVSGMALPSTALLYSIRLSSAKAEDIIIKGIAETAKMQRPVSIQLFTPASAISGTSAISTNGEKQ